MLGQVSDVLWTWKSDLCAVFSKRQFREPKNLYASQIFFLKATCILWVSSPHWHDCSHSLYAPEIRPCDEEGRECSLAWMARDSMACADVHPSSLFPRHTQFFSDMICYRLGLITWFFTKWISVLLRYSRLCQENNKRTQLTCTIELFLHLIPCFLYLFTWACSLYW